MRERIWVWGGIVASVVLIAVGLGALGTGVAGINEVRDTLAQENIVGTPDSTIPGQKVDTGAEAKAFAQVMREHTLEATGGQTYSEMGRFLDAQGQPTNDEAQAARTDEGRPVENGLRNMWVTETALATALNMSFFAERVALFSIVVGVALVLTGIGFLVLTLGVLRRALSAPRTGPTPSPVTA